MGNGFNDGRQLLLESIELREAPVHDPLLWR
jgi:hypothetical protein